MFGGFGQRGFGLQWTVQEFTVDFSREGTVSNFQRGAHRSGKTEVSRHDGGEPLGAGGQEPGLVTLGFVPVEALDHFGKDFGGDGSAPGYLGHFFKIFHLVPGNE